MPCVLLLFETQHSRLLESAQTLAITAATDGSEWPDRLHRFRRSLVHHDRMEREVLGELGVRAAPDELSASFDLVMAAEGGPTAGTVAKAARRVARIIEDHALAQETGVFPTLSERHPLRLRHQLGGRYFLSGENRWDTADAPPAAA